jgi:GT2 family glycosyltransferase
MKITQSVAVIMACHNRVDKTIKCLNNLHDINNPNLISFEVFLVDDASSDGTSEAVKAKFPNVHLIQGSGNLYWNRGMILAWETAANYHDFDYYIWLNDDVSLLEYAFDDLFECASHHLNSIVCGTMCSSDNKKSLVTYGGCDATGTLLIPNGMAQQVLGPINGNLVLIPQTVYNKLGKLDSYYSHGFGDNDYAYRAHKNDIPVYITKRVLGICDSHVSLPLWCSKDTALLKRLKLLYSPLGCNPFEFFYLENKHKGPLKAAVHFLTIHLRSLLPRFWN